MEFVIGASILIVLAIIIGRVSIKKDLKEEVVIDSLYDRQTINIMKAYMLIDDEECKLMLENLKKKEK